MNEGVTGLLTATAQVVRGAESYKTAANCLLVSEKQRRSLEAEVAQHASEAVKQRRLIAKLEQERELLHADKANLNKQVDILTDQLNTAKLDVLHYQRQLAALEAKLQAQVGTRSRVRAASARALAA